MALPILSRIRQRPVDLSPEELASKAVAVAMKPETLKELPEGERGRVDEVVKALSVSSGYVKKGRFQRGVPAKAQTAAVVAARTHQILGPSSTITPVNIALALQEQGMDWVEPFAPGTPLQPYYGYGRRPRQYDYEIGRNVTTQTRPNRIPFETLEQLYDGYDVARICTRHAINSLRSMCPPRFEAVDGYDGKNPTKEIAEAAKRLRRPDGKRFLPNWLAQNMLNLWKFDSAPIFRQRDRAGNLTKLLNVSAKTIAPMLDYFGDFPEAPAPAFQQFIEGVPWDWLTWDDIIYEPFWPETDSPYGTPPLETVLINANTDVRLQIYFLQFFTAGSVPEAFAIAPEGMTTGDDIADFEEQYYDYFQGDQSERWGLHWLPNGTDLQFYKPQMFDPDLAEYVMRRTVAAYLQTPHNLGFTQDVNRAAGDTQMDVQFRVTDIPTVGYYQLLLDAVLQEDWGLPVQIRFDTGRDREDRLIEAQAHQIYVQMGAESVDDVAEKILGNPVNPDEKIPRFVMDERLGIIPLAHILAISGDVDPLTGAPKPGTVQPVPYQLPGGGTPVPAEGPAQGGKAAPAAGAAPKGDPTKVYPKPLAAPSNGAAKGALPDGQTAEQRPPQSLASGSPDNVTGNTFGYGMGVVQGSSAQGLAPLIDPEAEEDAEDEDLRKWRKQARKRVGGGKLPRLFEDAAIRPEVRDRVWSLLKSATDLEQVDAVFKAAKPKAAGIAVQANDTGRVLLIQRTPDKHDPDEAYARWEFPGGKLDGGDDVDSDESSWEGAYREWSEETGAELPDEGYEHQGSWVSPDGVYQGFVVSVPSEGSISLAPDPDESSAARWWSKDDLDAPEVRDKVTDTLHLVTPLLKAWHTQPRNAAGQWSTHDELERAKFHKHTDAIVDHFTPLIERAMAEVIPPDVLSHALDTAYRVAKATTPPPATSPYAAQQAAVVAGTAGLAAAGPAAAGAAMGAAGAGVLGTALAMLTTAPLKLALLYKVISMLYAAAFVAGAEESAAAAGGTTPPWMAPIPDEGTPLERAQEALNVAQGGLADVLAERDMWIKEMTHTQVNRVGDAIRQSVEDGRPLSEARDAIDAIVHDSKRALMIAETEYARAQTVAARETYRLNGVPMVRWLHQPGACPACMENAAVSPILVSQPWPSGNVPVHPRCRCAEAPYYPPRSP